ncbi:1,4-dihydroxy-2-naphthoate octaprenyltransferase [Halobacteriovorax marinus]|uniref:1,4-dihydroxy-2-naphthoate octaprenyltransferase n=1 Tax=Halobacteriovorax marinus TaxID=97084 RepID=A0A1Y5F3D5_9BACT|nr:1,4-dihydroxy-2-naphthoate octaprenyltransferase [Halobacteriovorax marinus]
MTKTSAWIMATRPKTLTAAVGPVILGLAISHHYQRETSLITFFIILITALLLQVGTNLVNDYYDTIRGTDGDDRLGPTRVTQAGLLTPKEVRNGFILAFIMATLFGVYLMLMGGLPIVIIGILSLLFAYAYTGGPFPLSYFGLGEVFALIFFGPVPVWGTYFLLTGDYSLTPVVLGLGPGFIAAALMSINNLRDIKSDTRAKKFTLAVGLGEKKARLLTLLLVMASSFLPFFAVINLKSPWALLACFSCYLFIKTWKYVALGEVNEKMNKCLATTGKYLLLYCLLLSLGINL